ncbi:MAG: hypothetical protein HYY95_06015 [Candidatus Rokubacteria bacterium]|nr:hypothetical protein [Candidatus Rokubacteria bacterium]
MPRRVPHVRYGGDGPTAWAMLMTAVGIGGALFLTPPPETPPEGGGQGLVQEPEGEPSRERS